MKSKTNANVENIDYWQNWDKLSELAQDIIVLAKKKGATSSEVYIDMTKGLSANVRKSKVDTLEFHRDKSVDITIYKGKKKGNASISDLSTYAINDAIDAALEIAKYTEEDDCSGLAEKDLMAKDVKNLDLYHPYEIDSKTALEFANKCEKEALNYSDKIINSDGAGFANSINMSVYGNSHGFIGIYPTTTYCLSVAVIAKEKSKNNANDKNSHDDMQRDYDYTLARDFKDLTDFLELGKNCAKKTVARLNARKISTTQVPVIFHSDIASGIFGSFISAISGGNLFRNSSFLLNSLNTKVFPDFVQLKEDPFILKGLGSSYFDDEGVATYKKDIVVDGVVKSYILSSYSARKLKMKTTANCGGVHNLIVSTSNNDLDKLLKEMNKGLLVTELMGQGANIVTGDYSQGAFGFWVEDGKIQYPVHEITIAANLKDMYKNIVMIGNDIDYRKNIRTGSVLIEEMMIAGH